MPSRKKTEIAYISNEASRKASYRKRTKGLLKKTEELSTLCGVDVCALVYGPYDSQPDMFPNSPNQMQNLISRFQRLPDGEKNQRMMTQQSFLEKRMKTVETQIKNQQKMNREMEVNQLVSQCLAGQENVENLGLNDLHEMGFAIASRRKEISRRIEALRKNMACQTLALGEGGDNNTGLNLSLSNNFNVVVASEGKGSNVAAAPEMSKEGKEIVASKARPSNINSYEAGPSK